MFSCLFSSAPLYWRSPLRAAAKDRARALTTWPGRVDWPPRARPPDPYELPGLRQSQENIRSREICEVLSTNDFYRILGVPRSPAVDRLALRRAYLSRSKACHPDKCPGNPDATYAFQKVSIAYRVLSQPALKRIYDARPCDDQADFLHARPYGHADQTLKGVLLSIVNDYLNGNLGTIRTLLQAVSDLNPSLKLSDDSIDSVLSALENVRGRFLTCRACIHALHSELVRVLELQCAFRQLSYLDITGRSRLTIQLTRIALSLPVTLETAVQNAQKDVFADGRSMRDSRGNKCDKAALLPKHVVLLIRGIDMVLDKMERILG